MISPTLILIAGCIAAVALAVIYWLAVRSDRAKLKERARADRENRRSMYSDALNKTILTTPDRELRKEGESPFTLVRKP